MFLRSVMSRPLSTNPPTAGSARRSVTVASRWIQSPRVLRNPNSSSSGCWPASVGPARRAWSQSTPLLRKIPSSERPRRSSGASPTTLADDGLA